MGYSFASGPVYQPETIAYMTAIGMPSDGTMTIYGITGQAVWTAWDNYFIATAALPEAYYVRGITGGTAATHKFNAVNPLDTDAAYRATFFGGLTHSATGIQGNTTNGYANSHFNDVAAGVDSDDLSLTMYSRAATVGNFVDMGAVLSSPVSYLWINISRTAGSDTIAVYDDSYFGLSSKFVPDSRGVFTVTRQPLEVDTQKLYHYGSMVGSRVGFSPTPLTGLDLYELARNFNGSPQRYSNREYVYFSVRRGMTAAEVSTYHTAIQALQTALGRQV